MSWQDAPLAQTQPAWMSAPVVQDKTQDTSFAGRISNDFNNRINNVVSGRQAQDLGQQTGAETALQLGGAGGNLLFNDIPSEIFTSAWNYTPKSIQEPIKEAASNVFSSVANFVPPGGNQTVGNVAQGLGKEYHQFEQDNPRAARDISAAIGLGNTALAFTPIKGTSAVDATVGATKDIAQKGASALGDVAGIGLSALNDALGKTIVPGAAELKTASQAGYKAAEEAGGILKPEITNKFIDSVSAMKPQTEIGQIVSGDSPFTKMADTLATIKDKPMSLQAAQELDEHLGDAIDTHMDAVTGKVDKQGMKLLNIQKNLRDTINNATEDSVMGGKSGFNALVQARQDWSAQRQASDIERIINRANMTDNPATSMKNGFRTIASNPSRFNSFSPEAQDAIRAATKDGNGVNILRTIVGSRLISTGLGAGIGGAIGGPVGAAVGSGVGAGASALARGIAQSAKSNQARDILEAIAKNSSLGVQKTPLIDFDALKQIMSLPPAQAKAALNAARQ